MNAQKEDLFLWGEIKVRFYPKKTGLSEFKVG